MTRLFILSVDSLFFEDLDWLKECPNLLPILKNGSLVQQVDSVYPAMTYAAHATMLTGCYPDVHGIYHNEKVQVGNAHPEWHWRREELLVPTIIDAGKKAGYRFSVVNWPVTGADQNIDYNIPEIWSDEPGGDSRQRFVSVCSPGMEKLFDKYRHLLHWKYQPELDEFGIRCLLEVIQEHKPEVVMLHLSYLDHARHANGGFSPQAKEALLECDRRFGLAAELLKRQGLYDETNFVVMGDHGHLPVQKVFYPNVVLRDKGLITIDGNGVIKDWKMYCHSAGISCHVVLSDPFDIGLRAQAEEIMNSFVDNRHYGCEKVFGKKELKEIYHLEGPFEYVIEGCIGTAFGNDCTGEIIRPTDNSDYKLSVSAHGHLPSKGPQPTFFAAGPQIKDGVVITHGTLIDEAPTYAAILGVPMPTAQGKPITEILT
jgi:predicted AlkP superfamily pyrophosphatase or phosphodiesterase